ncbi:MAG: hypothetical protein HY532_04040 [Chloroflexi bacterium]|nr:hypothetical protein [Chloroflexota bacterium]
MISLLADHPHPKGRLTLAVAATTVAIFAGVTVARAHIDNHTMASGSEITETNEPHEQAWWESKNYSYDETHSVWASNDFIQFTVFDTEYKNGAADSGLWFMTRFIWDELGENTETYYDWLCTAINGVDQTEGGTDWDYDQLDSENNVVVSEQEIYSGDTCLDSSFQNTHYFRWEAP